MGWVGVLEGVKEEGERGEGGFGGGGGERASSVLCEFGLFLAEYQGEESTAHIQGLFCYCRA